MTDPPKITPRHAALPLKRLITNLLLNNPQGFTPVQIELKLNSNLMPGERPTTGASVRKTLKRLLNEGVAIRHAQTKKYLILNHQKAKLNISSSVARLGVTPTPPQPTQHHEFLKCKVRIDTQRLHTIKRTLSNNVFMPQFLIPRITEPRPNDRARQWIFEGKFCKIITSERSGKTTIWFNGPEALNEIEEFYPELTQEAKTNPRQSHRCWDRKEFEDFLIRTGNLVIRGDKSQTPTGDFEIQGSEQIINQAVNDITLSEADRLSLTHAIANKIDQLQTQIQQLQESHLTLLNLFSNMLPTQEQKQEQKQYQGEMYR